jgi:hypothetical protein
LARRIDAARRADGVNAGKALHEAAPHVARVEKDLPGTLLLAKDLARDDIARRELGQPMPTLHEALAARLSSTAPFAANRLAK